ncbi:DNA primase [Ferrovum sp.]|uniref:DNA primase n=1 Tax=Ferrovum sp. TaxID=2609467 RepID=UPI00261F48A0|nr:DNA primase [Ferrovum sp.]
MIPNDFIQTLLDRTDIVDLIGQSVPLKKSGVNYVARCPFHQEKTPSFSVNPQRQFFHCFGCGASGNALGFVMQHTGAGFVEAVQHLADQAGLTVPSSTEPARQAPSRSGLDLLQQVALHYQEKLAQTPHALEYLRRREVTPETAQHFGLGYAPGAWHGLEEKFPQVTIDTWLTLGMMVRNENGKCYDRFRDRLMFPIHDHKGQVIGFGGRVLDSGEPKYLNSPETELFEKGKELYGWPQARQALRQNNQILVVEGYMDVVSLSQAGIGNVVATLGTATTADQARRLLRSTDRILFAFDGDKAGRKAAERALHLILPIFEEGKEIGFLFFPEGEDPDSFVRQNGPAALHAKISTALPLSNFVMERLTQGLIRSQPEHQGQFLRQARELLATLTSPWLTFSLKRLMAAWLEITPDQLNSFLGTTAAPAVQSPQARSRPPLRPRQAPSSIAHQLMACLLVEPAFAQQVGIPDQDTQTPLLPEARALHHLASYLRHQDPVPNLSHILEHFRAQDEEKLIEAVLKREFLTLQDTPTEELVLVYQDGLKRWQSMGRQQEARILLQLAQSRPLNQQEKERLQWLTLNRLEQ